MDRRRTLRAAGALVAAALAGCIGARRPGEPTDESPDEPPYSFSVVATRCGTQSNRADVSVDGGSVVVEGTTWGNDACYTAHVDAVALDGGVLTVRVVTGRAGPPDQGCAQCITEIDYRATVTVASPPSSVLVVHDGETVTRAQPS